jgi:hypothetical protein
VIRGLGLYGELGRAQDQIQAADYKGRSRVWAAGLRAAVPLGRDLWLASNGRVDGGEGESIHADEEPDPERADYRLMSGTILVAWGSSGAGASAWAGAQSSWHWDHHVWPLGSKATEVRLDVPLAPTQQLSGVVGCGMTSEPVGLPWRTSPRLTVALEARAGQEWGVSGWVGVAL